MAIGAEFFRSMEIGFRDLEVDAFGLAVVGNGGSEVSLLLVGISTN